MDRPIWIFATNNNHKLEEARSILAPFAQIVSLKDIGFFEEVEETANTFHENALIKANAVFDFAGKPCFADDSGLCVNALSGAPGVFSARYANPTGPTDHLANNQKLLNALQNETDRTAYFITVISAVGFSEEPLYFKGEVHGKIAHTLKGVQGFGYDPLFVPDGYEQTFAELGETVKNQISHRANALQALKQAILH